MDLPDLFINIILCVNLVVVAFCTGLLWQKYRHYRKQHRLIQLGQLTAELIHDLSNAVTLISFNLEMAQVYALDLKNSTKSRQRFEQALTLSLQGILFIEESIRFAWRQLHQTEEKKWFNASTEVKRVLKILEFQATRRKVKLSFHGSDRIKMFGEVSKLHKVVLSLVTNAIESYTSAVRNLKSRREVFVTLKATQTTVTLEVQDWGEGIPVRNYDHIFQQFFTTKEDHLGLGLGLSIVKRVVEQDFHGKVSFISAEKLGTLFKVMIPVRGVA